MITKNALPRSKMAADESGDFQAVPFPPFFKSQSGLGIADVHISNLQLLVSYSPGVGSVCTGKRAECNPLPEAPGGKRAGTAAGTVRCVTKPGCSWSSGHGNCHYRTALHTQRRTPACVILVYTDSPLTHTFCLHVYGSRDIYLYMTPQSETQHNTWKCVNINK